ncbi:Transcription factor bHLH104 [Striga hermonthica]|uniref:Transcription factor bHLH104 n=1 Tax=Striga hermonthica TaxID=68872 RepID=A0A9N7MVR3_STRHE|nr:Transcription factor bHLH104 [Striga hermonthica]
MNDDGLRLGSFDDDCWSELFIDCGGLLDGAVPPADIYWDPQPSTQDAVLTMDAPLSRAASLVNECAEEQECRKKRGRSDQCGGGGTKACRERMRREKLNERFSELSAVLEPGRPMKTDKSALLGDAIRVLNQLKAESQEYRETNEKLLEEIKTLKAEKNELREEKLVLKADKERIEQQLKTQALPPSGFLPAHPPPIYSHMAGPNKMPMFPGYSYVPIWQYLPPSARDTSQDHHLRPPAA